MKNIILIGMPGCGKTTVAKELVSLLFGVIAVDIDEEIVKSEKRTINDIFEKDGEEYFRELETKTLKLYSNMNNLVISTGGGILENEENIKEQDNEKIVKVHVNDEVREYKTNDSFSIEMIEKNDSLNYLGLYLDEQYTITFSGVVTSDVDLYVKTEEVKKNKHISYYVNSELFSELDLDSDESIPDIKNSFNPRYNVSTYSDEQMQIVDDNIFSYKKDVSIYYKLDEKDEYKDIVIVRIYTNSSVARIELDKGGYLDAYLIIATLGLSKNLNLFYDEECTISYDFKPVEEDLVLYNNSDDTFNVTESVFTIQPLDEMAKVTFIYVLSNGEKYEKSIYYNKGIEITDKDFLLFRDEYISGIFKDEECTLPFTSEVLNTNLILYGKVEEPNNNAHKVTIIDGYCVNKPRSESAIYDSIYREFYVRDKAILTDFRTNNEELLKFWLTYEDGSLYNGEEITNDVTFYALNSGLAYSNKYVNVVSEKYIFNYNGTSKALFVIGNKTYLTGYDFKLYDAHIYLDSNYEEEYNNDYSFKELYLK